MNFFDRYAEKKWLSNACCFTTCSEQWVKNISKATGIKGHLVLNGYEEELYTNDSNTKRDNTFTVTHNGTLYGFQPVEVFLNAFKKLIIEQNITNIRLNFPGLGMDQEQVSRINNALKGFEAYYYISIRVPKTEIIQIQKASDLLLMVGPNIKGHHSSKIFEYLGLKKPIFLCPTDHDVAEQLVLETNSGLIAHSPDEAYQLLLDAYNQFISTQKIAYNGNNREIEKYSRKNQAQQLAIIFNSILQ